MKIYTDGGCSPNPGKGSWAFAVVDEDDKIVFSQSGAEHSTTNNKMELTAVTRAIQYISESGFDEPIEIVTDSEYVKKGLTEWMSTWKRFNWRNAAGKPIKNPELWKAINDIYSPDKHIMKWTRGHDGEKFNEFVDNLCTKEILGTKN